MVFDHNDNRSLVDGKVGGSKPRLIERKGVVEAILAPQFVAERVIEKFQGSHRLIGGIGKGRQSRCGGYDTPVIGGRAGGIPIGNIAGGQAPAAVAISVEFLRVVEAVLVVDERMVAILGKIIGVAIFEIFGI